MSMSGDILPHRFSPWILLISLLLTEFTLFFSALRPLKRIKKMTPVQAVSGEIAAERKEKDRPVQISASPLRLAMAGVRRNHGRTVITSLSAMLSVLLFALGGVFVYLEWFKGYEFGRRKRGLTGVILLLLGGMVFYRGLQGKEFRFWHKNWQSFDKEFAGKREEKSFVCPSCGNRLPEKTENCPVCGREL